MNKGIIKNRALPWMMWISAALFYSYENLLQVSPSVMTTEWMQAFHLTARGIGALGAFYFYAYASIQIPVGLLIDRFGPRLLLSCAALCCALGCATVACSYHFAPAALGRFLIGLGSGFAAIGCLHIAATCLPVKRFAFLTGLTLTLGMMGSIGGETPLALLLNIFHWRSVLMILAFVGLLLAGLILMIVRNHQPPALTPAQSTHTPHFLSGLLAVLKKPQSWIISLYAGLMFTPIPAFGALWGVPFLMRNLNISRIQAASIDSLIFIGFAIGGPLFGWLSDTLKRRRFSLLIASVGSLICLTMILWSSQHLPLITTACLLFGFGFFTSSFLPAFSIMRENHLPQHNAVSLGFMNTINMLGGVLAQPLIGLSLDQNWHHKMLHGLRIYRLHNYQIALSSLLLGILIALLLIPWIQETFCQNSTTSS